MYVKQIIKAAYAKLKVHRWIAWLLCVALMGSMISTALPALAVNDDGEETYEEETYCEHHPEHTEECGYVEAVEGQPCTHEHDENCGYVEAAECNHEHDEDCGYVEAESCTHEHDDECGYVEAVEGQPCQFVCEICGGGLEELPEEEIEQDVAAMADEPMALAAANEKGLIAEFTFNDVEDRLKNSAASSGVTAKLNIVASGVAALGDEITSESANWGNYFDGISGNANALHLNNTACLVLENAEAFKGLTELTVEMRVNITDEQSEHWLFYARPNGADEEHCLGTVIRENNRQFQAIREYDLSNVDWGSSSGGVLTVGKWHTIRVVYKISTMAIYIDGKRVQESGAGGRTAEYFEDNPDIWFGHSAFTEYTNFNGYIDDIKIYNYAKDDYPINEEQYILESVEPPNTTVHMFDYWITGQTENDFNPELPLHRVQDEGINKGHLFLFAGSDGSYRYSIDLGETKNVGSWNNYYFDQRYFEGGEPANQNVQRAQYEPFSGIVNKILGNDGYPQLALDQLEDTNMFVCPSPAEEWYDAATNDKKTESLAYLFDPRNNNNGEGKVSYPNVTGLFRLDEKGYYYFDCNETFAELNREQGSRPKKSTDNNRITLFRRSTEYKDFFPFNDATDLFYIKMDGKLDKANGDYEGMGVQATTEEPFNHYFGMTVETTFEQTTDGQIDLPGGNKEDMTFQFSGDDDVWIFVDDVLVADLGGLHNEVSVTINFATGEIAFAGRATEYKKSEPKKLDGSDDGGGRKCFDTTLRAMFEDAGRDDAIEWNPNNKEVFADGSGHTLKFFYLERGNNASRCTISFNMQHVEKHTHKKRSSSENVPVEPLFEEFVTLDVSTEELPKKKEETKEVGVLASPNTGDSNMVGLWLALLALSTAGLAAIHRTRKRGNK